MKPKGRELGPSIKARPMPISSVSRQSRGWRIARSVRSPVRSSVRCQYGVRTVPVLWYCTRAVSIGARAVSARCPCCVCHTALVVLGKCGSTHVHLFGPKKHGSVADGPLVRVDFPLLGPGTRKPRQQGIRGGCLCAAPAHVNSPTQLFAAGEQLAAHTQPALRTGLVAPAWHLLHVFRRVTLD